MVPLYLDQIELLVATVLSMTLYQEDEINFVEPTSLYKVGSHFDYCPIFILPTTVIHNDVEFSNILTVLKVINNKCDNVIKKNGCDVICSFFLQTTHHTGMRTVYPLICLRYRGSIAKLVSSNIYHLAVLLPSEGDLNSDRNTSLESLFTIDVCLDFPPTC